MALHDAATLPNSRYNQNSTEAESDNSQDFEMAIHLTEKAAAKIAAGLHKEGLETGGLRLGVKGGGCSGLSYVIRFEAEPRPGDRVFQLDGAQVFVDLKSYLYLKGMTLDWQGDFMQQGFAFINPNATKTCSCGQSFLV